MLVLHNVRMEPSNVRKKIKEPQNVTKIQAHMMIVLHNIRMKLLNVRKKKKRTTKYDKSIIICDIGTIQYGNETVK